MFSTFVSCSGKIIKLSSENNCITADIHVVNQPSGKISVARNVVWSPPSKQKLTILSARRVLEALTGEDIVAIAVTLESQSADKGLFYILALDIEKSVIVPLRKTSANSLVGCDSVKLVDGLTVLTVRITELAIYTADTSRCTLKGHVFATFHAMKKQVLDRCKCVIKKTGSLKILDVQFTGSVYLIVGSCPFLCKQKCDLHGEGQCHELFAVEFTPDLLQWKQRDVTDLIPFEYCDSIACLVVAEFDFPPARKNVTGVQRSSRLIAATTEGHILELESGKLTRCLNLESIEILPDPQLVTELVLSHSIAYDKPKYCIARTERTVYFIDLEAFKVSKHWSDIMLVFEEDFLCTGNHQQLLLKGQNVLSDAWVLTDGDTCCIHSDTTEEVGRKDAPQDQKSTQAAVEALQLKLQQDEVALQTFEATVARRAEVVSDVYQKQVLLMEEGRSPGRSHQPELLPLIRGGTVETRCTVPVAEEELVEVKGVWYRTYCGKWLVGLDFRNLSGRDLEVSLSVLPSGESGLPQPVTASSQVCRCRHATLDRGDNSFPRSDQLLDNQPQTCLPESKQCDTRTSSDAHIYTVTCVTAVPNFGVKDTYTVSVILIISDRQGSTDERPESSESETCTVTAGSSRPVPEDAGSVTGKVRRLRPPPDMNQSEQSVYRQPLGTAVDRKFKPSTVLTKFCGEVTLKASEVVQGIHELNITSSDNSDLDDVNMESIEVLQCDLAAWAGIRKQFKLKLFASPALLTSVPQLLCDRCSCSYTSHYSCYIVDNIPLLSTVQLSLGQTDSSSNTRQLTVYSGSDKELYLLLHHLYAKLPDNMLILPETTTPQEISESCLPCIVRHHNLLARSVQKLIDSHSRTVTMETGDDTGDSDDVRKVGEKFKMRREAMKSRCKVDLDQASVRKVLVDTKQLAVTTDSVIASARFQ